MRLILAIFILMTSTAKAAELYEVNVSPRALGMGNAYTAIVADKDALFYNPARLAEVKGVNLTIADPYLGANGQDVYDTYTSLSDASASTSSFATTLRQLYGKKIWVGGGAKAALTTPYFGVAGYDALTGSAYLNNPAYPNLNVNFINDYGFVAGAAFDIAKIVSIGFSGRRITRIGASFPVGVSTLAVLSSSQLQDQLSNRGTGYAVDFGSSITIPGPVKPTFSFVWKNLGYTTFTQDFGSVAPPMIKDEMIAGLGMDISLPGIDIRPAFDFKYLNRTDEQLGKKIHLGIEFDLPLIDIRGGFYQGYYTAGVGVDLGFFKVDAATYGVELGEYPGQHEDRRYVAQLTIELGFDPSFGFLKGEKGSSGSGSSSRRLKQRR